MNRKLLVASSHFSELCMEQKRYLLERGFEITENASSLPLPQGQAAEMAREADAVFVGVEVWDAALFDSASNLSILCRWGVGLDNIDLDEAKKRGIVVTSAAGCNHNAVAEHTLALILSLLRMVPFYDRTTRGGGWKRRIAPELNSQTVGLIGFGRIGKTVARRLRGFDAPVLVYDRYVKAGPGDGPNVHSVELDELLASSDVVSLHCPATPETTHLINRETIGRMKEGALLINTARGALVDEKALHEALSTGRLGGAGLDVFEDEPTDQDNPLFSLENVVVTPHLSAYTHNTFDNVAWTCTNAVIDFFEGREPANRIV